MFGVQRSGSPLESERGLNNDDCVERKIKKNKTREHETGRQNQGDRWVWKVLNYNQGAACVIGTSYISGKKNKKNK